MQDLTIPQKGGTTSLHVSTYCRYCQSASEIVSYLVRWMQNRIEIVVEIQFFRVRGTQVSRYSFFAIVAILLQNS